jgi:uncharacterized membrane protein YeaQ/YmgE (transglycosylase-associated protein family)
MSLLIWIGLGLIAAIAARALLPVPGGCLGAGAAGIGGALLGGAISTLLGFGGIAGGIDARNLIVAAMGAVVLLLLLRWMGGRRRQSSGQPG